MSDPEAHVGRLFSPVFAEVDPKALIAFADAVGADDPIHHDRQAARARGYRDLRAPPTYIFALRAQQAPVLPILESMGLPVASGQGFHAEQGFRFQAPVCAGMRLAFTDRVAEVRRRQGGRLTFAVIETAVAEVGAGLLATCRYTAVVVDPTIPPPRSDTPRAAPEATRRELARQDLATLTSQRLAAYAAASGDHNPIHRDPEHARAAGLPGVIGHGMLTMGLMTSFLARQAPLEAIGAVEARFQAPTAIGETLSCAAYASEGGVELQAICGGRRVASCRAEIV